MHTKSPVLLIGSGRLAKHLKFWNSLLAKPNELLRWDRSQDLTSLNILLDKAQIVWLAISDSSIEEFFNSHIQARGLAALHFSGALSVASLSCAHPLMSFPNELLPAQVYPKIQFIVSDAEAMDRLPGFGNSFSILTAENRSYYHALCVLAGNFPQLLWNEVENEMSALNIPHSAIELYIQQITANFLALGSQSITGPLARKDYVTIEKNISSLGRSTRLQNIYATFVKEFSS